MSTKSPDRVNRSRIIFASLIGTTIEFFDFYIYATAAVSVFPLLFFPAGNASAALLASMATFGVAFVARPIGSMLFGHFGDRMGRKATLIGSLLLMGVATFVVTLSFALGVQGYQFSDATSVADQYDANWLMVKLHARRASARDTSPGRLPACRGRG